MPKKKETKIDYSYESIDSGIKNKIITEIETEIKKDNSKFFEEQPPIPIKVEHWKKEKKKNEKGEYEYKDIPFADGVKTIINEIFDGKEEISLSRSDVFGESDTKKKIIKVLMWGYPEATMPWSGKNNIIKITKGLEKLAALFNKIKEEKNLDGNQIKEKLPNLRVKDVSGLGIATLSKLLYFFEVSFEGKRCLIYDSNVKSFLNHLEGWVKESKWDDKCYFKYLGLMNDLMSELKKDPGIRGKIGNLIKEKEEKEKEEKEKEEKKIEEKIYEQIEFYMFTKGKALGGGEEKDNEAE